MAILTKNHKCSVCGEVMEVGTHARFEPIIYATANGGGFYRNTKPRFSVRHEGLCPKQRMEDYNEALGQARYYHEAALGHMFRGRMETAKEAFHMAHLKVKQAKRLKKGG